MRRIEKPWGYELIWAHTDRYVGKLLHINAGNALSRQYHVQKEETLIVLSGELILELGDEENRERRVLGPREAFHVAPGTIHRFISEQDVELMEVSTPELDDVVRLEDRYGREGTSDA